MNMKLLLVKDLRSKKVADISEYINNLKTELHSLSHDASVGKSKKSHEFRVLKKSIAPNSIFSSSSLYLKLAAIKIIGILYNFLFFFIILF